MWTDEIRGYVHAELIKAFPEADVVSMRSEVLRKIAVEFGQALYGGGSDQSIDGIVGCVVADYIACREGLGGCENV